MTSPRAAYLQIEFRGYSRKFLHPLATGRGVWRAREGLIVRLSDADGRVGYGEAAPAPGFTRETPARDYAWLRNAPGQMTEAELRRVPRRLGCLKWAIHNAQEMLAGRLKPSAKVRKLPVAALLPAGRAALPVMTQRAKEGYRVFKWKIGLASPPEEFSLLEQLLAALPAEGRLRLDANGALGRREWAAWCDGLNALGPAARAVEYFEQPLPPATGDTGWREQVRLAAISTVPVALDEGVADWSARHRARAARWPGPLVVKPSLLCEVEQFAKWRTRTHADLIYSSAFETSIGLYAALCLASSDPHPGRRALGFGTLDAFAADGLQLPAHKPGPSLALRALTADDFLDAWQRLASGAT